ncbi:MAG TPA: hypothetical protein VHP11_12020 [Tepidisphaeraceae bacterium]|nr:hypothetical protein [Tepidisphaeraceae bacterium]
MSDDFFEITCPDCKNILIVRRRDGKVMEVRKPILEESTGDRFDDAFLKVKRSQSEIEKKFEAAREKEKNKMERLNALFKEGMERTQKEGPIKRPEREVDLD